MFFWEGLWGNQKRAREGREARRTDKSSKEEAAVGGGWLAFGGLDTHSVWSWGCKLMCVCTHVGGCVCVKQITGK